MATEETFDVWEIDPGEKGADWDVEVCKDDELNEVLERIVESHLNAASEADLMRDGVTFNIKLNRMTQQEYDKTRSDYEND